MEIKSVTEVIKKKLLYQERPKKIICTTKLSDN